MGQFRPTATAEVETTEPVGPVALALMENGLLNALQRVPASKAEKHVAVPLGMYAKDGTRPKEFKRGSIPYSDENAMNLASGFGTEVEIGTDKDGKAIMLKFAITDVVQHVPTDSGATKEATAEWVGVQALPEEHFKGALQILGLDPEDYDDDRGVQACKLYLQAEKKAALLAAKNKLSGLFAKKA